MSKITWGQIKPILEGVSGASHINAPASVQEQYEALCNHFYELGVQEGNSEACETLARRYNRERRELAKALLISTYNTEGAQPHLNIQDRARCHVRAADALLAELDKGVGQ